MRPTQTSSEAMSRSTCLIQYSSWVDDHCLGSVPKTASSVTGADADRGGNVCARSARSLAPGWGKVKSAFTSSARSTKGRNTSSGIAVKDVRLVATREPPGVRGELGADCGLHDCWASDTS